MLYYYKRPAEASSEHTKQKEEAKRLLLFGLQQEYGMETLPGIERDENGKPFFPEEPKIQFNYSHCRRGILCGISSGSIGADIETIRPYQERLARKVCHCREWELLEKEKAEGKNPAETLTKIWVIKEAYLKYTGEGLRRKLPALDVSEILRGERMLRNTAVFLKIREGMCLCACAEHGGDLKIRTVNI
ncbi:MAG: 4'-phosphopantetheinyl transferase superfamily protein [Eubacteriales bacterium]|nr:4'-phosphopantetheinyl transferase superfamily protein [Eubacteriales bacterium]